MSWLDQYAAGGGGGSAGVARGVIEIDTTPLARARRVVVSEAKAMGDALRQAGDDGAKGADAAAKGWAGFNQQMDAAVSRVGQFMGLVTMGGIGAANSLRRVNATMTLLAGSTQQAAQYQQQIRDLAEATNQPYLELLESAAKFIPATKATNVELSKTVLLAQRLMLRDPTARVKDATIAIQELLEGQYRSLQMRFGVKDEAISAAVNAGDYRAALDALDAYLTRLGITEESLTSLGKTGVTSAAVLSSEFRETAAQAFDPLANALNRIMGLFADLMRQARELNPELLRIAGTVAGIYGLGSLPSMAAGPLARLGLGTIPGAGMIQKAGVGAAALFGGAHLGAYLSGKLGEWGVPGFGHTQVQRQISGGEGRGGRTVTETASTGDILGGVWTTFKQILVLIEVGLSQLAAALIEGGMYLQNGWGMIKAAFALGAGHIGNAIADVVEVFANGAKAIAGLLGDILGHFGEIDLNFGQISLGTIDLGVLGERDLGTIDLNFGTISTGLGDLAQGLTDYANSATTVDDALRTSDATMQGYQATIRDGIRLTEEQKATLRRANDNLDGVTRKFAEWLGVVEKTLGKSGDLARGGSKVYRAPDAAAYTEEQFEAWLGFQDELKALQSKRLDDLAAAEQDYNDRLARMDEDDARERERAAQRLEQSIAAVHADAAKRALASEKTQNERIADSQEAFQERVAELREDAAERELRAAEDYQRKREQLERDHRDALIEAALRLDASAVWAEQRRYARQREDLERDQADERAQRQKQLADRLADEQKAHEQRVAQEHEAHAQRLEQGREADAERIADLRARYADEQRLAEEDRRIARDRMAQDHQRRIQDINTAAINEYNARQAAFIQQYNQLAAHESQKLGIQRQYQAAMLNDFEAWLRNMRGVVAQQDAARVISAAFGGPTGAAIGGTGPSLTQLAGSIPASAGSSGGLTLVPPPGSTIYTPGVGYSVVGGGVNPIAIGQLLGGRHTGGDIDRSGLWNLRAGEHVIEPGTASLLKRMMGGSITPSGLAGMARAAAGQAASKVVENLTVNIYESQDPTRTKQMVFQAVMEALS